MSSLLRAVIHFAAMQCARGFKLFAIVIGPAQSHKVDELWVIFIMITPTLTGFLSLMASTCEVKVGMKADARWQSIFKCEHCEGSALASFQWKSR